MDRRDSSGRSAVALREQGVQELVRQTGAGGYAQVSPALRHAPQPAANTCVSVQEAEALVAAVLPADRCAAAPEIAVYLKESVGNPTRIDYGTGNGSSLCAQSAAGSSR